MSSPLGHRTIDREEPLAGVVVLERRDFERVLRQAFASREASSENVHAQSAREGETHSFEKPETHTDPPFERALAHAARVDDMTAVTAATLAGRANQPGVVGVLVNDTKRGPRSFSS